MEAYRRKNRYELEEASKQLEQSFISVKPIYFDTDSIKVMSKEIEKDINEFKEAKKLQLMSTYGLQLSTLPIIKSVYPNEEKKLVVVKWCDNSVTKVTCGEDDSFDIYVGVAIAVCKKFFGSNTQFRKTVDNLTKGAKK